MDATHELAGALEAAVGKLALVVTGAGISKASGIPTFRGNEPGAIWKESDVSMATLETFTRDPVAQWEWYLHRFRSVDGAEPNAAHTALARAEEWLGVNGGTLRVVTQNIDTLHERAGSRDLIKVHGTSDRLRCGRGGCANGAPRGSLPRSQVDLAPFRAAPSSETLPRCPDCGAPLRAHVLFFDEYYQDHSDYRFDEVQTSAAQAEVVIFIGTSFSVGVTELVLQAARQRGKAIFSIDPHAEPLPEWMGVTQLLEPAEKLLPRVVDRLEGR